MKYILKLVFTALMSAAVFSACHKVDDLSVAGHGTPVNLQTSATDVAPVPADSLKTVLTLSWTSPNYATAATNEKYIIEIDSTGRNFSKEYTRTLTGIANPFLTTSFTAKELNTILLSYGYPFSVPVTMDVRITSSYANNNERLQSNVVKIKMTPYKTPPKVAPPSSKSLFIVGSATAGGWGSNPVPLPSQQFKMIDSVTYKGTFNLLGGGEYLLLPVNGSWDHKYSVANKGLTNLNQGGDFGFDLSDNIPGPAVAGIYTITVDFQRGKFTVVPVKTFTTLYVPGNYQNWDPPTAATLVSMNADGSYQGYINVPTNTNYEFKFTDVPNWNGTAYGDGGGGTLSTSGGNLVFPGPGYYQVKANIPAKTWSVTLANWALIGDFNSWGGDAAMTYDASAKVWKGTITAASAGFFKFRANGSWDLNLGDTGADGGLEEGGDNIAITAGVHTITLDLHIPGNYTYSIQ